ncbi:MAG: hypothetical protein ACFE8M_02995 [Candidatus Hermodarchaeota archaeon]
MSEDQNNDQENLEQEREKLKNLGVKGTWNILTDLTKKKKEE